MNTRDEPHADAQKYRRLHVIAGDANCSETATFLKMGTTALVLAMVEDDALTRHFTFMHPVQAMRQVSYDLTLRRPIELADGTRLTALEIQWELLEQARKWAEVNDLEPVGGPVASQVLDTWEAILTGLETDVDTVGDRIDWVAKHRLLSAYRERNQLGWDDPKIAALALQYHDLRPHRSLASRVGLVRIVDDDEAVAAMTEPPPDTRAYFRGRCLQRWADSVVAANWDSVVFDIGEDSLRRIPMMEPMRGTRAHVGTVIDESDDPAQLIARLGGA